MAMAAALLPALLALLAPLCAGDKWNAAQELAKISKDIGMAVSDDQIEAMLKEIDAAHPPPSQQDGGGAIDRDGFMDPEMTEGIGDEWDADPLGAFDAWAPAAPNDQNSHLNDIRIRAVRPSFSLATPRQRRHAWRFPYRLAVVPYSG